MHIYIYIFICIHVQKWLCQLRTQIEKYMPQSLRVGLYWPFTNLPFGICDIYSLRYLEKRVGFRTWFNGTTCLHLISGHATGSHWALCRSQGLLRSPGRPKVLRFTVSISKPSSRAMWTFFQQWSVKSEMGQVSFAWFNYNCRQISVLYHDSASRTNVWSSCAWFSQLFGLQNTAADRPGALY